MPQLEIIDGKTVRQCLNMPQCIDLMADTLLALHRQQAQAPQRISLPLFAQDKTLLTMPGAIQTLGIAGTKTLSLCEANPAQGRPAIQGLITLLDLNTGAPIALVDAASITAIRTAAASAAATRVLARESASRLALIGTGIQAKTHLEAMMAIRPIKHIHLYSRREANAQAFAQAMQDKTDATFQVFDSVEKAIASADIICTLTSSPNPLIKGHWLKPGVHLNLVGAHTPDAREVDSKTIQPSRLFVELKSTALREAGDILIPLRAKQIQESHILGEVAEVIAGNLIGRNNSDDITVYKSLGNAAQDLAAAYAVLEQARIRGLSKPIDFCL